MSEQISNAFHSIVGGAKQSLGKAVGSEQLASEGKCGKELSVNFSSLLAQPRLF